MNGLSQQFMNSLQKGSLKPLISFIKRDLTLSLEIRDNEVHTYYRGGRILRIESKRGSYIASIDSNYFIGNKSEIIDLPKNVTNAKDIKKWLNRFPLFKQAIDIWMVKNSKNEREFAQLLVRENNFDRRTAIQTDYFICDMEYTAKNGRFDFVAAKWPSNGPARRNKKDIGLAIIELKYGDGALSKKSGLSEHVKGINKFASKAENIYKLKKEMKIVFNQKKKLGLILNKNSIEKFNDDKLECIIILANHDPDSKKLKNEIANIPKCTHVDLKFAVGSFMGYGLYNPSILLPNEFYRWFNSQIFDGN